MLNVRADTVTGLQRRATDLSRAYQRGGGITTLNEAISVHRQLLELYPVGNPDRSWALGNLANFIQSRYKAQRTLGDLEEAISLYRQASHLCPIGDPNRSASLNNLAICMHSRYQSRGALADLEEAISLNQQVLDLSSVDDPDRVSSLNNLANCMQSRHKSQGVLGDLDEAISLYQQALDLHPIGHPKRSSSLSNLAKCRKSRYDSQGALGDLEIAISLYKQALDLCPVGHPNRPSSLTSLANCMQSRYQSNGALVDLDEAISLHQQALKICPAGHPSRSMFLSNLASCMKSRYKSQGALGDLEEAISFNQQALDLHPAGHPHRSTSINNLANCMQSRYKSQGALGDLEEAISLYQLALDLRPVGHPDRSASLCNLASCIQSRYDLQGALGDLEEAMFLHQQALDLHPVGHSNRSTYLNNFGSCMQSRYKSQGELEDLEKAISLHQQALELCPVGHENRVSSLTNLANCMQSRFKSQGTLGDMDMAISLHQQALDLCPIGHPHRSSSLNNLASYLDEAISLHNKALVLRPVGHPHRPSSLNNLAMCMQSRYESQAILGDLEEGISLLQQSLSLCAPGSMKWTSIARVLSLSLGDQFSKTYQISDILQALSLQQDTSQLIRNAMQDILHDIPPRLLQTSTGILFTQAQMTIHFCESTQCQTLVKFLQQSNDWNANVNHIQETISTYFQYSTLSHRWGSSEPSLQDVLCSGSAHNIAVTKGVVKLQRFCQTAAHHGYSWAWSDTCCIDKTNSVELQKAIGSMFLWYQKSALTIVYLADISSSPFPGTLSGSEWFKRGWTLQELLAPCTILFYTQDWIPYMNSTAENHKQDTHVLNELENATGIPPKHLSNFHSGMDNARSRLQWAVGRHTTVPEDIAYSLFGIFNLHLPVLYGEGKEKSLLRLLQEILSQSRDISILHWVGEQSSRHSCFPANISSYQPLPHVQPDITSLSIEQSMSRLQQLVSSDDAYKVYNRFTNLPCAKFTDYMLTLPCIVHDVQVVKLRQTYMNCHTYDVQAVGLRPVQIITTERLLESIMPIKLPYVLIHPWDRSLVNYLEEDGIMAGYKTLIELEKPFMALMLLQLPEGEYRRICASHFIVAHADDPASI
ncbi:hypothetical protein ID866_9282, partial [Astraeus odoratus]